VRSATHGEFETPVTAAGLECACSRAALSGPEGHAMPATRNPALLPGRISGLLFTEDGVRTVVAVLEQLP
jgi:hypothetical protein